MDSPPEESPASPTTPELSDEQRQLAVDRLRAAQNLPAAVAAGAVAGVAGAVGWAAIAMATGYQTGFVAIAIGLLVGLAVRHFGQGIDPPFAMVGAAFSLVGCALGNLFIVCAAIAEEYEVSALEVLSDLDVTTVRELMVATFEPMDLLFYGIAVYEGFRMATRDVSDEELARTLGIQSTV